jgi:phosphoribosyl 1,2-cyclic phosphodiesterase
MPLLVQLLASGSKGNSLLVCSPKTRVLVDAGLSGREIARRLQSSPAADGRLDALVVSHEHTDHVRGMGVLSRRHDVPVYLNQGTLEALPRQVGEFAGVVNFFTGTPFRIQDLVFQPFSVSHDARDPVGFVISHENSKLGVCTDLGVATKLVRERLRGCRALVLESNHDPEMLINGPYPWPLKQRIQSRHGHLCNSDTLDLLAELHHEGLRHVVLAHLSETNNRPERVREGLVRFQELEQWRPVSFQIGSQQESCRAFQLDQ